MTSGVELKNSHERGEATDYLAKRLWERMAAPPPAYWIKNRKDQEEPVIRGRPSVRAQVTSEPPKQKAPG